jgi:hypothetical protein
MPQMGHDTKTDRLTVSRNVTLTLTLQSTQTIRTNPVTATSTEPVSTSYQSLLQLRDSSTATCPAIAGRQEARLLAEPARVLPAGANLRGASSLQSRLRSPASSTRNHSAAARFNTQAPRTTRPPQRTGNSTRVSSATTRSLPAEPSLLLSERPREIYRTQYGPFRGHHPPAPAVPVSCLVLRSGGAVIDARLPW